MREKIIQILYKLFPFDLKGDSHVPPVQDAIEISCIINFYGRIDLLRGILFSLAEQDFSRDQFEVILVEDKGGSDSGRAVAEEFSSLIQIRYFKVDKNYGLMGYSRNQGLSHSRGKYVLFLDDDTVILQNFFLQRLVKHFEAELDSDAIMARGQASYGLLDRKYDYHEPYFMTSRCTAYRRTVLSELGGFISQFIGQEDVEFVVRFVMAKKKAIMASDMEYHHPPLVSGNFKKPKSVGFSFYGLRARYPFVIWLLVLLNCSRHAPLILLPIRKYREMGRFGIGFIMGVFAGFLGKKEFTYGSS